MKPDNLFLRKEKMSGIKPAVEEHKIAFQTLLLADFNVNFASKLVTVEKIGFRGNQTPIHLDDCISSREGGGATFHRCSNNFNF